jgi:hypothetical protein
LIGLNKKRVVWAGLLVASVLFLSSLMPVQSAITYGRWRDINPTQYSTDITGTLRGDYVRSGGTGGIGAGDGWAVGGDSPVPIIAHYDGFSWQIMATIISLAEYNAAHFCTAPGAPGVGLCSPNGDGSDGWIVGAASGAAVALYWDGAALTQVSTGLPSGSANLTSVFMVCHSPPFGSGCPGSLSPGLTYAVGTAGGHGIIFAFNGNPKAGGGWTSQFVSSLATRFNSVYMYVGQSGNLAGFAVGDGGVIATLTTPGGWVESRPLGVTTELLGVFVDQGNPADAWVVGRGGLIGHFLNGIWGAPTFPLGTSNDLVSIFLTSTSEGWIVGTHSTISHSTNLGSGVWSPLTSPLLTGTGSGIDLLSVSFPSGSNGWAVGSQGVILHTENSNCGPVPPCWGGSTSITQTSLLTSVFEKSSNDAWAGGLFDTVSGNPTLLHWDGNKWHRVVVSGGYGVPNPDIYGIFMLSSSEGWAVGGNTATPAPAALKWDGNTWTSQPVAACLCTLRSVYMISGGTGGDGWAVGTGGLIYRYQSGSWLQFAAISGSPQLNSVFISNAGNNLNAGWAVGNLGTVLKLSITGGVPTWNVVGIPGITAAQNLFGVFFTDSNHGWIVGDNSATIVSTTDGGAHWSGGSGQVIGAPVGNIVLKSVFIDTYGTGSGNGDGWAVGNDASGNALFAHWDGQSWTDVSVNPTIAGGLGLASVYLTSPTDGFAVGAGPSVPPTPLAGIFHLDPPSPPIWQGGVTSTTSTSSSAGGGSSTGTTSTASIASTATSSASGATSSTQIITSTATITSSSVATGVLASTATAQTTTFSGNTLLLPPIPGFPWESILIGAILGLAVLAIARRHKAAHT